MMLSYQKSLLAVISCALSMASISSARINLGSAGSFGVVAGTQIINTGTSVINGAVGVYPGAVISGFPPGIVTGPIDVANAEARTAHDDVVNAFNMAMGLTPTIDLTGQDLGYLALPPGVYALDPSATLNGLLTLDAQGDANALFVLQTSGSFTAAFNSDVVLANGAQTCNVFFGCVRRCRLRSPKLFQRHRHCQRTYHDRPRG